jgi:ubiquinone/menaquinone biosynthesis C-methylase UbiE
MIFENMSFSMSKEGITNQKRNKKSNLKEIRHLHVPSLSEYSLTHRLRFIKILTLLNLQKQDRVLEVGSGSGYFIGRIAQNADFTVGLEYVHQNTLSATIRWKATSFVTGDAINLPFRENSFDKILCTEVIEHIENDSCFIEEAYRVLKVNGILVITTPNLNPTFRFYNLFKRLAGIGDSDIGHVRRGYNEVQIKQMLINGNFVIDRFDTIDFFLPALVRSITYMSRRILSSQIIKQKGWGGRRNSEN